MVDRMAAMIMRLKLFFTPALILTATLLCDTKVRG